MEDKAQKMLLQTLLAASILGAAISSYLLYNHYLPESQNGLCISANLFSCSVVNTSEYANLFGLPLAVYGIVWFVFLGLLSYAAFKNSAQLAKIVWWNILGFASVIYLIVIEFMLKTICLLCTGIHALVLIGLFISTSLYISQRKQSPES